MSTSLMYRNAMNSAGLDEQNAYRLAMELSMLSLNGQGVHGQSNMEDDHLHHDGSEFGSQDIHFSSKIHPSIMEDPMAYQNGTRKSANMTETVPVPSSEHVAEIVGRQGCKIKALRAKTNTYIKTPVRGALPVFVVTGRKEDVAQAKLQILSAADHFSQIRASRRTAGSQPSSNGTCSPTSTPGHVTTQVRVPYKVVGLVVGPKGATIKRIQQTTSTYIVTPGRDKEPVFEVTGLPDNVEKAREEIEKHIASRTGTDNNSDLQIDDFNINGIDSGFHEQSNDPSSNNTFTSYGNNVFNIQDNLTSISSQLSGPMTNFQSHGQPLKSAQTQLCNTHAGAAMKISSEYIMPPLSNFTTFNGVRSDSFEVDEGIGASGGSIFDPTAIWSDASSFGLQRSNSISASSRILPPGEDGPHPRTRRTNSDPLAAAFQKIDATFNSSSPPSSQGSVSPVTGRRNPSPSPPPPQPSRTNRTCIQCGGSVTAALVPCGHNSFCYMCANEICHRPKESRICPICHEVPSQPILIRNDC